MESGACEVILLHPPFFRFLESHNDRMPLTLCYLSAILERASISHKVYNADFTGSDTYWGMKRLFDTFDSFQRAVDDHGDLYDEVVGRVAAFGPSVVVISGADPLIPTKDLGSPFIASNFSRRLRELGIFTVGVGPYFTLDPERFSGDFDSILGGEPSETLVDIIKEKREGFVLGSRLPPGLIPSLSSLFPAGQKTDAVMTSFGCLQGCSFCVAGKFYKELGYEVSRMDPERVATDILRRNEEVIYLMDLDFSVYPIKMLRKLFSVLMRRGVKKEFVIESTVRGISEERLKLYSEAGVSTIKLGIEGVTAPLLSAFKKKQSVEEIKNAVAQVRKYHMNCIAYLLIGGAAPVKEYEETRELIEEIAPDNVVVSIWAYDIHGDYRYDTQFSPVTLKKWGLKKEVFYDYLRLQKSFNSTVGRIIPSL